MATYAVPPPLALMFASTKAVGSPLFKVNGWVGNFSQNGKTPVNIAVKLLLNMLKSDNIVQWM